MKRIAIVFLVLAGFYGIAFTADAEKWQTAKSTHFIVYYDKAPQDFLNRLISSAEEYYDKIANDLGFRRYDFWLWDDRAKVYIYNDINAYRSGTGQPNWSAGVSYVTRQKEKVISTFLDEKGFFDTILPHEMGHIIFREFVGFYNSAVPLWLDEGVASYQERGKRALARLVVEKAAKDNTLISLGALSNFNPYLNTDEARVALFYLESLSIVDFLINRFGSEKFVFFCQVLRDKKNLPKALVYAYSLQDIQELDRAWQGQIKR
jgi:hypothetical protein